MGIFINYPDIFSSFCLRYDSLCKTAIKALPYSRYIHITVIMPNLYTKHFFFFTDSTLLSDKRSNIFLISLRLYVHLYAKRIFNLRVKGRDEVMIAQW